MLTIFSAPKPFEGDIGLIQENAIGSWIRLHPEVEVLLMGDDGGIREACAKLGVRYLDGLRTNEWGTPLVSSLFEHALRQAAFSDICFVNTDVILLPDLLEVIAVVRSRFQQFLIVGQRWDLVVQGPIGFSNGWRDEIRSTLKRTGTLHPPAGSDYFVFSNSQYSHLPPFAIGRAGWDNWMIYEARHTGIPVVDATSRITAVHQDHDYGHLPDGKSHYRLPESQRNLQLAGGPHTVFTLQDATWEFGDGKLLPRHPGWRRWIEATILARLGPSTAGSLAYAIFHPIKTFGRARGAVQGIGRGRGLANSGGRERL